MFQARHHEQFDSSYVRPPFDLKTAFRYSADMDFKALGISWIWIMQNIIMEHPFNVLGN